MLLSHLEKFLLSVPIKSQFRTETAPRAVKSNVVLQDGLPTYWGRRSTP